MLNDLFNKIKGCDMIDRIYIYENKLLIISDEPNEIALFDELYFIDEQFMQYEATVLKVDEYLDIQKRLKLGMPIDEVDDTVVTTFKYGVCNKSVS